ncbi:putative transmembrane emp24 domain-containing protein [Dioscorea sansibarensis]
MGVRSPSGNIVHSVDAVDSGHFGFTSTEGGNYMACFWTAKQKPPVTTTVEFNWNSGIATTEWAKVVKRNKIDSMAMELKVMGKTVESIHEEMLHLRQREVETQDRYVMTNSKMALFTLLSFTVCLSVAGLQLYYLKTFFQRKKLI